MVGYLSSKASAQDGYGEFRNVRGEANPERSSTLILASSAEALRRNYATVLRGMAQPRPIICPPRHHQVLATRNISRHVVIKRFNPRSLSYVASYDVASNFCRALGPPRAVSTLVSCVTWRPMTLRGRAISDNELFS